MTTPQKQKRREILFIVLVAVVLASFLGLSIYDDHRDDEAAEAAKARDDRQTAQFQKCITDVVSDLVGPDGALTERSKLTEKDGATVTTLISELLAAENDPVKGDKAVKKYVAAQKRIGETRAENPFPDFPDGKCEFLTEGEKKAEGEK